jgi:hypothetical protein
MPPSYRQRLRIEGAWLAACGVAGSVLLLATTEEARRWPLNTAAQLGATAAIAGVLAHRGTRRAIEGARPLAEDQVGGGEPTPLWMHPLIVGGLAAIFPLLREAGVNGAGWDASLRITGGAAIVGLTQALLIERMVAAAERDHGMTYYRGKGSRGIKTVLVSART